jgi:hypothetical protein
VPVTPARSTGCRSPSTRTLTTDAHRHALRIDLGIAVAEYVLDEIANLGSELGRAGADDDERS